MTTATAPTPSTGPATSSKKEWAPRIWQGCNFLAWMRLLMRNRFAIELPFLYIAIIVTFVSALHSLLRWVQETFYGPRLRRTAIPEQPIFIIGHWRTGTTFLHELLILDRRHTYPTTYECFEPNHFLLTEGWMTRWLWFLMPSRRPMDNMRAGWDRPQEDEFALCMLGQPSPYLTIAFPNRPPQDEEYLDLVGVPAPALARWKHTYLHFLKELTLKDPRRLVLKSPTHTARIRVLLELFPDARFVHIVRDPYVVFPSTVNLWKSLYRAHGLQQPQFVGLEEHVFKTFIRLHERLEADRPLIPPGRFHELRYEDLVRDPVGQMQALYDELKLDGFEIYRPELEAYLEKVAGYERNRYELTEEQRAEITRRWGPIIRRQAYPLHEDAAL